MRLSYMTTLEWTGYPESLTSGSYSEIECHRQYGGHGVQNGSHGAVLFW
jgi:hypothetical protein